jgi:hypothetical protein
MGVGMMLVGVNVDVGGGVRKLVAWEPAAAGGWRYNSVSIWVLGSVSV